MAKKLSINVSVGGHNVPLRVDWEDEALYRSAAKRTTQMFDRLAQRFPEKTVEEIWMLTAYSMTIECGRMITNQTATPLEIMRDLGDEVARLLEQ